MRKTNKTLSALLATVMLAGAMASVAFAHDPFNNDLFTVEKEITFEDGYLPRSMESYNTLPNEDYSVAKIVKEAYNENGEAITLDVPAKIINGRTLVPVRFVSDCFGVNVDWDGTMQKVILTK